jgi:ATP citrate (pro-S)-lyase
VYGPETHITAIVAMALGVSAPADQFSTTSANASPPSEPSLAASLNAPAQPVSIGRVSSSSALSASLSASQAASPAASSSSASYTAADAEAATPSPTSQPEAKPWYQVFSRHTRAIVYGMQPGAVQNMLDFDFICSRAQPSVAAIVYEFSPSHHRRFYWGSREVQLPVYNSLAQALTRFPEVDTVVSFASSRSVFESTREMLGHAQLRTIALIAEGVPERRTRQLIAAAAARQPPVLLVGPATVGGIKPGAFRIGNTGGMLDNILASKLYRPGSVACALLSAFSSQLSLPLLALLTLIMLMQFALT